MKISERTVKRLGEVITGDKRLSRRQRSRLIVFLPLNPEEFTTSADCEMYSALLVTRSLFAHKCGFAPMSR